MPPQPLVYFLVTSALVIGAVEPIFQIFPVLSHQGKVPGAAPMVIKTQDSRETK